MTKPIQDETQFSAYAFEKIFDSSFVRVLVDAGLLITSFLLLGFKDDITKNWPFGTEPWPGFSGCLVLSAAIYWACVGVLFVTGICRHVATAIKEKRTGNKQNSEKNKLNGDLEKLKLQNEESNGNLAKLSIELGTLKEDIETLPGGPTFREHFAAGADDLQVLLLSSFSRKSDLGELAIYIRKLLTAMADLADAYGPTGAHKCSAYVMTFVEQPPQSEMALLKMVPTGYQQNQYQGWLFAEPDLFAPEREKSDDPIQRFALGVVGESAGLQPAMPGPQLVFKGGEIAGVPDVKQLEEYKAKVTAEAITAFINFCETQKWAFGRSYVSLPLQVPQGKGRNTIGVVTITSDGPNIMGGMVERWEIFYMIMRPYSDGIAILLQMFLAAPRKK